MSDQRMRPPVLETVNLGVRYERNPALVDANITVDGGQLVGLIGPNGAGKTTLIDAVTGFVRCSGDVLLEGRSISSLPPHRRSRRGLARTWQSTELFDDLTVRENVTVASHFPSIASLLFAIVAGKASEPAKVHGVLDSLGIGELADKSPQDLSQGQRKLVGIARALVADPKIVCLDEPAAGLDASESHALGKRLRRVVEGGTAMLLVDHDMGLVLSVCDYVYVLTFGSVLAEGTPEEVRANEEVMRAYLGEPAEKGSAQGAPARPDRVEAP